jgi:hypothetical protein
VHEKHEIRIHGRGGQGAVLACSILAQALISHIQHTVDEKIAFLQQLTQIAAARRPAPFH